MYEQACGGKNWILWPSNGQTVTKPGVADGIAAPEQIGPGGLTAVTNTGVIRRNLCTTRAAQQQDRERSRGLPFTTVCRSRPLFPRSISDHQRTAPRQRVHATRLNRDNTHYRTHSNTTMSSTEFRHTATSPDQPRSPLYTGYLPPTSSSISNTKHISENLYF